MSEANRPRIAKATRFFARPESFTLECPRCGEVYKISSRERQPAWDPSCATFTCSARAGCGKKYVIGLLAWPIGPSGSGRNSIPRDQVPHPRQLSALRREGGGWWMPESEKHTTSTVHETNITLEPLRPERDDDDQETDPPD